MQLSPILWKYVKVKRPQACGMAHRVIQDDAPCPIRAAELVPQLVHQVPKVRRVQLLPPVEAV